MLKKKWYIIDTHTHLGAVPNMIFTAEMAIKEMDKARVDKTIAIRMISGGGGPFGATQKHNPYNGNDYIAEAQKKYPDRIIGFCMVDFFDQNIKSIGWQPGEIELVKTNNAIEELKRSILELELNGLFMHPDFQGFAPNNFSLVSPILDTLTLLQKERKRILPVLLHGVGNNLHYTTPEQIGEVANKYSNLVFIVPILGWMLLADSMIEVAKKCKNIYLELMLNVNVLAIKKTIREIGAKRLTLGTDAPWGSYYLGQKMIEELADDEEKTYILGRTVKEIMGIG